jgi:hypothetical protein
VESEQSHHEENFGYSSSTLTVHLRARDLSFVVRSICTASLDALAAKRDGRTSCCDCVLSQIILLSILNDEFDSSAALIYQFRCGKALFCLPPTLAAARDVFLLPSSVVFLAENARGEAL